MTQKTTKTKQNIEKLTEKSMQRSMVKLMENLAAEDAARAKAMAVADAFETAYSSFPVESSSDAHWAAYARYQDADDKDRHAEERTDGVFKSHRRRAWNPDPQERERLMKADEVFAFFESEDHDNSILDHRSSHATRWGCPKCDAHYDAEHRWEDS